MEKQIGDRIAEERKKLKITQNELAEKLMVSNKAVSKWESNGGYPSIEFLPKLADLFGCSIDYLVRGKNVLNNDFEIEKFIEINYLTISNIQRYFKIGYSDACNLRDELSKNNYVFINEEDGYYFDINKKDEIKDFMIKYLDKIKGKTIKL